MEALLQRGATIYEFDGTNERDHMIPGGRQHLGAQ